MNKYNELHKFFHLKRVMYIIENKDFTKKELGEKYYIRWQTQFRGKHKMSSEIANKFNIFINNLIEDIDKILDQLPDFNILHYDEYSHIVDIILDFCRRWEINKKALFSFKSEYYFKLFDVLRKRTSLSEEKYGYFIRSIIEFRIILIAKKATIRDNIYLNNAKNKQDSKFNIEKWHKYYSENREKIIKKNLERYHSKTKSQSQ